MNNINISSINGGGEGNNLNLIRIPSLNEVKNIIVSSDLNGSITPGNSYTWQYPSHIMIYQNNKNELALAYKENDWINPTFYVKSTTFISRGYTSFHTVIEFREY